MYKVRDVLTCIITRFLCVIINYELFILNYKCSFLIKVLELCKLLFNYAKINNDRNSANKYSY